MWVRKSLLGHADIPKVAWPSAPAIFSRPVGILILFFSSTLCYATSSARTADPRLGLPPQVALNTNSNREVIQLGKRLFFDSRLSADGTVSCSKCHVPKLAFSDGQPLSPGRRNQVGTRNAPSLLNVAYANSLFWDGRATDLESQALAPLINPIEHGFSSPTDILQFLRSDHLYVEQFASAFDRQPRNIDIGLVQNSLSAYERTLFSGGSAFDKYSYGRQPDALNVREIRGLTLFRDRAHCAECHTIGRSFALFTDGEFHFTPLRLPAEVSGNLGALTKTVVDAKAGAPAQLEALIATDKDVAALGRFVVTLNPNDIGRFKTPSLRNVALTGPYMHDGSVATLEEAVDLELYGRGNSLAYPISLTADEQSDLIAFLRALTSPSASAQ